MGLAGDGSQTSQAPEEPRDAREYFQTQDAAAPSTSAPVEPWVAEQWSEIDTGSGARPLALTKPAAPVSVSNPFEALDSAQSPVGESE